MKITTGSQAFLNLKNGVRNKTVSMPSKNTSEQYDGVGYLPTINPKFKIPKGSKIFTIGSCFAREIEDRISNEYDMCIRNFTLPEHPFKTYHWGTLPVSHLLNEYNLGTIHQRIVNACNDSKIEGGLVQRDGEFKDLLLHIWAEPKSKNIIDNFRFLINEYYSNIKSADVIVITLGLIECWYDTVDCIYLNTAPSQSDITNEPSRYHFCELSYEDTSNLLNKCVAQINKNNPRAKILLTVSPVPLEATFSGSNCIVASFNAKAILRASINYVTDIYDNVDYFPSYEIVQSRGCQGFTEDNTHVNQESINAVFKVFDNYFN